MRKYRRINSCGILISYQQSQLLARSMCEWAGLVALAESAISCVKCALAIFLSTVLATLLVFHAVSGLLALVTLGFDRKLVA